MSANPLNVPELEKQVDAFNKVRSDYEVFAEILKAVLDRAVRELGVMALVQVRAKDVPSFAGKVVRKQGDYPDPVHQFTDLCGARLIVGYKDEIPPVCDYIRRHFEIDEANS